MGSKVLEDDGGMFGLQVGVVDLLSTCHVHLHLLFDFEHWSKPLKTPTGLLHSPLLWSTAAYRDAWRETIHMLFATKSSWTAAISKLELPLSWPGFAWDPPPFELVVHEELAGIGSLHPTFF